MYAGEAINILIDSRCGKDIKDIDFSVYIYPDEFINNDCRVDKKDCVEMEDGSYMCTFAPEVTANLAAVSYTVELHDKTNNVVFVGKHAFRIEPCASACDIRSGSDGMQ